MRRLLVLLGAAFTVSGCAADFETDRRYRTEGPGNDLYSIETARATENLQQYFGELAIQADLVTREELNKDGEYQADWELLVWTGLNDIDLRCDNYLTWIDQKRAERVVVNESITAISALTAGVLGIAAPATRAINYVALALGFAGTVYNSYQNSILLGIESSTIKTVVHERRLRMRAVWRKVKFANKPDTVYALRSYLRICTPQAITLDINTFTRDGMTDTRGRLDEEIRQQRAAVQPIDPIDEVEPIVRNPVISPPGYDQVFEIGPGWRPQEEELRRLQLAMCFSETATDERFRPDGRPGAGTKSGVAIAESEFYADNPTHLLHDGKIDKVEFDQIVGRPRDCASLNVRNYHEAVQFGKQSDVSGLIEEINDISQVCISKAATLAAGSALRARIAELRVEFASALAVDADLIGVEEQLTVALSKEITKRADASGTVCTP